MGRIRTLRVLCGRKRFHTEITEPLRELCVKSLVAQRAQRNGGIWISHTEVLRG